MVYTMTDNESNGISIREQLKCPIKFKYLFKFRIIFIRLKCSNDKKKDFFLKSSFVV